MATILKADQRDFKESPNKIDNYRISTDLSRNKKGLNPENLNFEEALADMKIPVLVLVGEDDWFFNPETTREEFSPVPDLTFVTIPGIGHAIERSDLILPHVKEFLARVNN